MLLTKQLGERIMSKIWELFPDLTKRVKEVHEEVGLNDGGHDFDHVIRVSQMAFLLALDYDELWARLAGVAGLLHNNDRILERKLRIKSENISRASDADVAVMTSAILSDTCPLLKSDERRLIVEAVINHGSKPNNPIDHLVTIALTDADRLINMEPDFIIRSAQQHYDIPSLDPIYLEATPGANYKDPKTVAWDIANSIMWAADSGPYILRLPKARELGRERAAYLRKFFDTLKRYRADLGLIPYPEI